MAYTFFFSKTYVCERKTVIRGEDCALLFVNTEFYLNKEQLALGWL